MDRNAGLILGVLTLLTLNVVMVTPQSRQAINNVKDLSGTNNYRRYKRSAPYVLGRILKGATLIVEKGDYRLYSKPGGYAKASADFNALKLNNPRDTKHGIQGTKGDKVITLRPESRVYGDGVIDIWTVKYGSIEPVKKDRIRYSLWTGS